MKDENICNKITTCISNAINDLNQDLESSKITEGSYEQVIVFFGYYEFVVPLWDMNGGIKDLNKAILESIEDTVKIREEVRTGEHEGEKAIKVYLEKLVKEINKVC